MDRLKRPEFRLVTEEELAVAQLVVLMVTSQSDSRLAATTVLRSG